MQPWFGTSWIPTNTLQEALRIIDIPRKTKKQLSVLISEYGVMHGHLMWSESRIPELQKLIQETLIISDLDINGITSSRELEELVASRMRNIPTNSLREICHLLTMPKGGQV